MIEVVGAVVERSVIGVGAVVGEKGVVSLWMAMMLSSLLLLLLLLFVGFDY